MKVCFDAFAISHMPNTGLYSYSCELVNNLINIYPHPKYKLLTNNNGSELPFREGEGLSIEYININRRENDYSLIGNHLRENKVRLYHSTNNGFSIPKDKICKYVVTIHDMLPLSNEKLVDEKYLSKFTSLVPKAIEKSDKIIAVSDFIRHEIIKHYNISEEKVEVVYPTTSKRFKPIWAVHYKNYLTKKYNITDDFILYVGSIHERKNLLKVISVFKEVVSKEQSLRLLMIGGTDGKRRAHYLHLKNATEKLGIEDKVAFLGSIDYKDMPYFYNAARCVLNLSTYEGYPLTSVEAKACEAPLICSDNSSFKEVLGDYPVYGNINDHEEIVGKVLEILQGSKENKISFAPNKNTIDPMKSVNKVIDIYENLMYSW